MQSVSSRIWTRVTVFISYDDNNYTTLWKPEIPNADTYIYETINVFLTL